MKLKINISMKFAIFAAIAIITLISILTYSNYLDQKEYFEAKLEKQIGFYSQMLNNDIREYKNLTDENKTNNSINKLIQDNPEVKSINIILSGSNNTLWIINSNNKDLVGTVSENLDKNIFAIIKERPYTERIGDSYDYLSIMPIYASEFDEYVGTYELVISAENDYNNLNLRLNNIILLSVFFSIFALIFLYIIVRYIIQNKIINLKNAANDLRKGNLDVKVDIKSKDEIGDLATTFNEMAKDLKESRGKIEEYNKILEKIIDQKDEFIGQLGHDLKNPLQSLVGLLPILIDEEKDPEKKELLKLMNKDVEYIQSLIIDTLKLARLRTDRIEFDFKKINLKELVDDVIETQKPILIKNNIEVENKIDDDIYVWADGLRIKEVFDNLINNSIKYSKKKFGIIRINAEKIKNEIKIKLSDQGIGMTKEQMSKVFDEFYTANKELNDHHSTGLGLAISKRIVEKHGGAIWAESKGMGLGSIFYFTLKRYGD